MTTKQTENTSQSPTDPDLATIETFMDRELAKQKFRLRIVLTSIIISGISIGATLTFVFENFQRSYTLPLIAIALITTFFPYWQLKKMNRQQVAIREMLERFNDPSTFRKETIDLLTKQLINKINE